jgi:hypothetical protein
MLYAACAFGVVGAAIFYLLGLPRRGVNGAVRPDGSTSPAHSLTGVGHGP